MDENVKRLEEQLAQLLSENKDNQRQLQETKERLQREEEKRQAAEEQRQAAEERLEKIANQSVWKYFQEGVELPDLVQEGTKTGPSTNHIHKPIESTVEKKFGVISIPDLDHCKDRSTKIFDGNLTYGAEADVQSLCRTVLEDMIFATNLGNEISLKAELEIAELKADFWVISIGSKFPIGAVEVKKPGKPSEEDEKINYGQLFDYMARIRSFHGLGSVLGIYTNFNEWRICWFPDSDECALAEDLEYGSNDIDKDTASKRTLHMSALYTTKNTQVLCTSLFSALSKMRRNVEFKIPMALVSLNRSYIYMNDKTWVWKKGMRLTNLSLFPPSSRNKAFFLLRDFHGGADGRVWLACSESGGNLAVIKFQRRITEGKKGNEQQLLDVEVKRWHACGITSVYRTHLCGRDAIIMPFGFHFNSRGQIDDTWWKGENLDAISISDFVAYLNLVREKRPSLALEECIKHCSKAKLIHEDIEWRHVSMFPVPPPRFTLVRNPRKTLRCNFIDLTRMTSSSTVKNAKLEMEKRKPSLISILEDSCQAHAR
jgi:hypothetical protein